MKSLGVKEWQFFSLFIRKHKCWNQFFFFHWDEWKVCELDLRAGGIFTMIPFIESASCQFIQSWDCIWSIWSSMSVPYLPEKQQLSRETLIFSCCFHNLEQGGQVQCSSTMYPSAPSPYHQTMLSMTRFWAMVQVPGDKERSLSSCSVLQDILRQENPLSSL